MVVDHYIVSYMVGEQEATENAKFVRQSGETDFKVYNLIPYTFASFTIAAEYQGTIGPEVSIGISTSN